MRIQVKRAKVSAFALGFCCLLISSAPPLRAQDRGKEKHEVQYRVDGSWPKRLPPNWTIQGVTGMFVDKDDHIWVLNRPRDLDKGESFALLNPPTAECCVQPPAVLEFDVEGNLLRS